jgi:hypothetical protein
MLEALAVRIVEKATDSAVALLNGMVTRKNNELLEKHAKRTQPATVYPPRVAANITSSVGVLQGALQRHVEGIEKWCAQVRFEDLRDAKSIQQIYVELDTFLLPLNTHESDQERSQIRPLLDTLKNTSEHCLLLGTAGAGKTTSLQKVCSDFFSTGTVLGRHAAPVLIRLRELGSESGKRPLVHALSSELGLQVQISVTPASADAAFSLFTENSVLAAYLDGLNVAILVDGFDEIPTEELREHVLHDIAFLATHLRKSRLLITSRSADFRYKLSTVRKFEIAPLSPQQVEAFARRWLRTESKAADFLAKVYSSPFADTTIRPLSIAHLCAIYERIQDIPDKPKSVYKRIVRLLLEDWDAQRSVKRISKVSQYAKFDQDRKFEFLAHLAFHLTTELKTLRFSRDSLHEAYDQICSDHELPRDQAALVASELESHSGLIIQSGFDHYEFAHKSLQEYLAADYIVRLPALDEISQAFELIPNELAIATSLSSKPSHFLTELFLGAVNLEDGPNGWISPYLARLAIEKPELHIGANGYSAIAAMVLMSRMNQSHSATKFLAQAFPRNTEDLIRQHYLVTFRKSDFTYFSRSKSKSKYNLPASIRAPSGCL